MRPAGCFSYYCVRVLGLYDTIRIFIFVCLVCFFPSVLLECSCCSTVKETLENVAHSMASRLKAEKSHWAAGRAGNIDFIDSTKTRGKVKQQILKVLDSLQKCYEWNDHIFITPLCLVCESVQEHWPSAHLPDANRRVGPRSATPRGGPGGGRWAGTDEAVAQGHTEKRTREGCTEHRLQSSYSKLTLAFDISRELVLHCPLLAGGEMTRNT